jgi:hypothetical protein
MAAVPGDALSLFHVLKASGALRMFRFADAVVFYLHLLQNDVTVHNSCNQFLRSDLYKIDKLDVVCNTAGIRLLHPTMKLDHPLMFSYPISFA